MITGPESTGKTTLTEFLAKHYHSVWVPEYARDYVENLNRPYCFDDLVNIAIQQVKDFNAYDHSDSNYIFFDTDLIITKVWFEEVYKSIPVWLSDEIKKCKPYLSILCYTDVEWKYDSIRENPGEKRNKLYLRYKNELEYFSHPYKILTGKGLQRFRNVIQLVESII